MKQVVFAVNVFIQYITISMLRWIHMVGKYIILDSRPFNDNYKSFQIGFWNILVC